MRDPNRHDGMGYMSTESEDPRALPRRGRAGQSNDQQRQREYEDDPQRRAMAEARRALELESSRYVLSEMKVRHSPGRPVRQQNFLMTYHDDSDFRLDFSKDAERAGLWPPPVLPCEPKVHVIVVTHNCWPHTEMLLNALVQHRSYPYVVTVVDNGSSDGTFDRLARYEAEWFNRAAMGENVGLARAINAVLEHVQPDEDVVLLNNDIVPSAKWCESFISSAYEEPDTGVVGCKLRSWSGKLQHLGSLMRRDFVGETNLWGIEVPDNGTYPDRWYPDVVMFSAVYIPAAARAVVPRLDPGYFAYLEDSDYCYQLRQAGLKVIFDGRLEMLHAHNATVRENGMDFRSIFAESRKRFIAKWKDITEERANDCPVVMRGFYYGMGGYPRHFRELARSLDLAGVPVWLNEPLAFHAGAWRMDPIEDNLEEISRHLEWMETEDPSIGEVVINFCLPHRWIRVPDRLNIGLTMLETDGIPRDWVDRCNAMDAIWVPSQSVKRVFHQSGVIVPIQVLEGPLNTHAFHPKVRGFQTSPDVFRILSVFEWGERKAPEALLEACGRLAREWPDLELILKTGSNVFDITTPIAAAAREYGLRVQVLSKGIHEWLMPSLYRSADLFVLPSRGEGCGYGYLEAMASGVPVVGTDCTAQQDYLSEETGWPVKWDMVPARALCPLYKGFNWARPDVDHLVQRIREAREGIQTGESTRRAIRARAVIEERYSHEAVAAKFKELIAELCRNTGRTVPGWCSPAAGGWASQRIEGSRGNVVDLRAMRAQRAGDDAGAAEVEADAGAVPREVATETTSGEGVESAAAAGCDPGLEGPGEAVG